MVPYATAANPTFATDYDANSDVTQHGNIDLDVANIINHINNGDAASAKVVYEDGLNSSKGGDPEVFRTLQGFSTGIGAKAIKDGYKEMAYSLAMAAGNVDAFADTMTLAELAASTPSALAVATAINVGNTRMYAMHEFYDAIADAKKGAVTDNDGGAKAWDEGVAFYCGGQQVKGAANINSIYGMIETLAPKFGETTEAEIADINALLMEKMKSGRDKIQAYTSTDGTVDKAITDDQEIELLRLAEEINGLFTAFNIRMLIATHKSADFTSSAAEKTSVTNILATAIHSELNACDKDAAADFKANTISASTPQDVSDNWATTMLALQENYHCMMNVKVNDKYHQSCSLVGAYDDGSATQAACDDADIYPYESTTKTVMGAEATVSKTMVGYEPGSNVAKHALLDKDLRRMGVLAGDEDFLNAYFVYANGWNSWKTNDDGTFKSFRNYKAFASESKLKLFQEGLDLNAYFGTYKGHDNLITAALQGTTPFDADTDATARKEIAIKTTQFGLNLYYVIREFYDAKADCVANSLTDNYDAVHAWDEGVAFWAGSLEGIDGADSGEVLYMLAEKRSGQYAYTPATHGKSASSVNADLVEQFIAGEAHLVAGDCDKIDPIIEKVISLMIVPVIQGAQRYAWKVGSKTSDTPKSRAEGWAFASSILPMVEACDPESADIIEKNMDYNAQIPMADGTDAVFEAWQKTFQCLGITCKDVGEFVESKESPVDAPACKDDFSDLDGSASRSGARVGAALAAIVGGVAATVL